MTDHIDELIESVSPGWVTRGMNSGSTFNLENLRAVAEATEQATLRAVFGDIIAFRSSDHTNGWNSCVETIACLFKPGGKFELRPAHKLPGFVEDVAKKAPDWALRPTKEAKDE